MGHRLSKIVTRTGDGGETGLADGSRTPKDSARIRALGEVDELNSTLGVLLAEELPEAVRDALTAIQHDLFDLGGGLAIPGADPLRDEQVAGLEQRIEEWNAPLAPLKEFILPGGTRTASLAHLARTVCRRAERALVALGRAEPVPASSRRYLNRLSDLLFVLGRVLNREAGRPDVLWRSRRATR
ncbi:MAG: ATP:cob(I)alamin adenosyltransferase [Rhodocyclales bacterium CG_4_10_14_3_um_filter_68_10]|nr:MAG: ATP:cob(I)alamin adenosyltransferase [Rhodocyclales bacterium CG_4_10_14_3_um_filter_68_10]